MLLLCIDTLPSLIDHKVIMPLWETQDRRWSEPVLQCFKIVLTCVISHEELLLRRKPVWIVDSSLQDPRKFESLIPTLVSPIWKRAQLWPDPLIYLPTTPHGQGTAPHTSKTCTWIAWCIADALAESARLSPSFMHLSRPRVDQNIVSDINHKVI